MRRLRIIVRRPGQGPDHAVVLGRFGSVVLTALLTVAVAALLITAFVFGYLVLGLLFAAFLIAVVIALILGAFRSLRR
jgi:hypothetical protein